MLSDLGWVECDLVKDVRVLAGEVNDSGDGGGEFAQFHGRRGLR